MSVSIGIGSWWGCDDYWYNWSYRSGCGPYWRTSFWYDPWAYHHRVWVRDWCGPYSVFTYDPWWCGSYYTPYAYGSRWEPAWRSSVSIGLGGRWGHGSRWGVDFVFSDAPVCAPRYSTLVCADYVTVPMAVVERPVIVESPVVVSQPVLASADLPRAARPEELRSSSDRELGDTYMRLNDAGNAIRVYQQHLDKYPGDAGAQRALGLAMILDRRPDEGFRAIERAYRIDPGLAGSPISAQGFADAYTFRRAVDEATGAANKADTAAGWLAVAALMQADGRADSARAALARAKAAGLDPAVWSAMSGNVPQ